MEDYKGLPMRKSTGTVIYNAVRATSEASITQQNSIIERGTNLIEGGDALAYRGSNRFYRT